MRSQKPNENEFSKVHMDPKDQEVEPEGIKHHCDPKNVNKGLKEAIAKVLETAKENRPQYKKRLKPATDHMKL
ncbi:hypothetical protein TNCV_661171 [Trichonephila clavipes]|nr:hypothetical protein TNCV_661171 [Trichonephila clavipes]